MKPAVAAIAVAVLASCKLGAAPVDEAGIAQRLSSATPQASASTSPIGTNLAPVNDWSTERPFADLMKQSRAWISNTEQTWDDGQKIDVDAHGWPKSLHPGQRARTLVIWGDGVDGSAGDYVVTWQGTGALDFWPQEATRDAKDDHRAVVHLDPKRGGLGVTVTSTDVKDGIRDIHVYRAADAAAPALFSRTFLDSLKGYAVLRFMDWNATNESKVVKWSDRAAVDDARWSEKGVPLEVMIELCNATHADMWLTVPDTWDDDAVKSAAKLVHDKLDPKLLVYVESSNEVWNGMFPQAKRAKEYAVAHALSKDPFEAQLRRHAQRSIEIFKAFTAAYAGADRARLVRVMGSMAPTPHATDVLLSEKGAAALTDAVAIAPYVGVTIQNGDTLNVIFNSLIRHIDDVTELIKQHKKIADKYKVKLVAYEGGQHLVKSDDDKLTKLFIDANRDPRMKDIYTRALKGWKDAGGGLFLHYFDVGAPSKFGNWGARENLAQARAAAPKYDALMAFAEATPRWW